MQVYETQKLHPDLNKQTIISWFRRFRKVCTLAINNSESKLGGHISGNVVEIDESLFARKIKYHKGRVPRDPIWVFGAVERGSRRVFLTTVARRNRETLLPLIKSTINVGAHIHSDEWAAYANLSEEGYIHDTVNHTEEFRSDSGCCTNNIEGIWSLAKLRIKKMKGVLPGRLQDFLDEFCYRYRFGNSNGDVFWRFLADVAIYGHMVPLDID